MLHYEVMRKYISLPSKAIHLEVSSALVKGMVLEGLRLLRDEGLSHAAELAIESSRGAS